VTGAPSQLRASGPRLAPALLLLAWALLLAAWVVGNAPFAAPDEGEHFIRAVGISEGHLIGKADTHLQIGVTPAQIAWTAQAARLVSLPRGLEPDPFECELGPGEHSAGCLKGVTAQSPPTVLGTLVGNYQPLPYLLPALVLRAGASAPAALRWGRAAGALLALALLAIAVLACWEAASPVVSLLGLMLAVTPMVLFCAASLSGSGTEIAASIAFFACLLRVSRRRPAPARWWALTATTGSVLALSRSDSPAWLIVELLVVIVLSGPRAFARRWLTGLAPRVTAAVLLIALALNRAWESAYGSHVTIDTAQLHAGLVAGVHQWWRSLPDLVGKFGYVDVALPFVIPIAWFALAFGLLVFAAASAPKPQRRLLVVVAAGALMLPVVFYALIIRPTGFGLQGRHVLPLLVLVPVLAGELLNRHRARVGTYRLRVLSVTVPLAAAVMQVAAWYVNAKRYAVGGSGPEWFLSHAAWAPPAGWWTWLSVVVLASICLAGVALLASRETTQRLDATALGVPTGPRR
jgi:hypothetical protein